MVSPLLTINLNLPLSGVRSDLHYRYNGQHDRVATLPVSVDGVILAEIGSSVPEMFYFALFPEQIVNGVTYEETISEDFNLLPDVNVTISVTLNPKGNGLPPTPPEKKDLLLPLIQIATGLLILFLV